MTRETTIQTLRNYFSGQPVKRAWLFGSYARGDEKPTSDIDILFVPDYSGKPFTIILPEFQTTAWPTSDKNV